MEWDLKMPSWDFGELDRAAAPSIGSSVIVTPGSNGGLGRQQGSGMDCSVDLKLGGLGGDSGAPAEWEQQQRPPPPAPLLRASSYPATAPPLPAGSSKRARAPSGGAQNTSCLVDGCKADLSNCREYHRRHKVCEAHSKTPVVHIGGQEQRFCQQCSRFHSLAEFDEVKRSCRKRLDGHNRRRRKPQPEPLSSGLFSVHQGPRYPSYPHIFQSAIPDICWSSTIKTEDDSVFRHLQPLQVIERQQEIPGTFRIYKEGKQFPFSQDNDVVVINRTKQETSVSQTLLSAAPASESSNRKFPNRRAHIVDSDCALSLLSSATQTSTINLDHMVPADQIPFGQPLVQNLQQYGNLGRFSQLPASNSVVPTGLSCLRMDDEQGSPVLVSTQAASLNCHDVFNVGCEGSSVVHPQALPFSWQ